MTQKNFKIGQVDIGLNSDLFVMAGPCVIESQTSCLKLAEQIAKICEKAAVNVIFKASFDKANRSSISSFRGPGLDEGLKILEKVRDKTGLPIMTDIHEPNQATAIGQVVDCIQIPAFLCRQTDLLSASAKTGKPVNVKKGQFMSPEEMKNAIEKITACKNNKIMLTERGTFFGYNRLVNDMMSIEIMKQLGCPVIFDATHSTQRPGALGTATGGNRQMTPILANAAIAAGANALFLEVHPDPENSKSDAGCIMPLEWLEDVLKKSKEIFQIVRSK